MNSITADIGVIVTIQLNEATEDYFRTLISVENKQYSVYFNNNNTVNLIINNELTHEIIENIIEDNIDNTFYFVMRSFQVDTFSYREFIIADIGDFDEIIENLNKGKQAFLDLGIPNNYIKIGSVSLFD